MNKVRSPFYVWGKMQVLKQREGKYREREFTREVHM